MSEYVCEKCGKIFTEDYRKDKRSIYLQPVPRFCSKSCANSRQHSLAERTRISQTLKDNFNKKGYKKEIENRLSCKNCGKTLNKNNESGLCQDCIYLLGLRKQLTKRIMCEECGRDFVVSLYSNAKICEACRKEKESSRKEIWDIFSKDEIEEKLNLSKNRESFLLSLGLQTRTKKGDFNYGMSRRVISKILKIYPDLIKLKDFLPKQVTPVKNRSFEELKTQRERKKRLIEKRGHRCELCNTVYWRGFPITLELHHKDGNRGNNTEENLQLLCPNCHSQTDTFKGKRKKNMRRIGFSLEEKKELENAIISNPNMSARQLLLSQNFSLSESNYGLIYDLKNKLNGAAE